MGYRVKPGDDEDVWLKPCNKFCVITGPRPDNPGGLGIACQNVACAHIALAFV